MNEIVAIVTMNTRLIAERDDLRARLAAAVAELASITAERDALRKQLRFAAARFRAVIGAVGTECRQRAVTEAEEWLAQEGGAA